MYKWGKKLKGLGLRVLTAVVTVPLLILLLGWVSWYGFAALATAAIGLSIWELFKIVLKDETPALRLFGVLWGGLLMVGMLFLWQPPSTFAFPLAPPGVPAIVFTIMGSFILFLFLRGNAPDLHPIPGRIASWGFGVLYLGIFGAHIVYLARLPDLFKGSTLSLDHAGWAFLVLLCTFAGDTGGYFMGKTIGGPKMYPAVSPKKTWAGLFGCILGASGGAFAAMYFSLVVGLNWIDCIVIGLGVALLGQAGDLSISLCKRAFKVKDTGAILPGHGGILDRIDALLFTGPFIFYYAIWVVLPRM